MNHETLHTKTPPSSKPAAKNSSLGGRSEEVLIAVATLGLVATIVDGNADTREIEIFTSEFRKRFALTRRQSLKVITAAVARIRKSKEENIIDSACDTLNEYLDSPQKLRLFDGIADILVADRTIHEGEVYFLDYIERKLNLKDSLERTYPAV